MFLSYTNVPPCGNLFLICLHWKLLAPLHVWLCTLHVFVYVVLPICLSWVIKYVYVGLHIMYAWVVCLSLFASYLYLSWLLWEINGTTHFGGVMCFVHFTNLQMCVHEEYHLVLILQDYIVSMWYVFSWEIQILNSPLIISWCILLLPLVWLSLVSHYGGVICFVYITSLENVYIWGIAT